LDRIINAGSSGTDCLTGVTTQNSYDALGRLLSTTDTFANQPKTLTYGYDAAGRRTWMRWPDGKYTSYAYDRTSALTGICGLTTSVANCTSSSATSRLAGYIYDDLGRVTRMDWGRVDGLRTDPRYDGASRLRSLSLSRTGAMAYTYNYNAANQIVGRSSSNPDYLWLPEEDKSDDYGVVNGLNQYSSVTVDGTARALSYNAQANLTADGVHTYKYDAINRMFRSDDLVSLFYNAADQLHLIDDYGNGARRRLLYDGEAMVVEYAGNGTLLRRYIHGLARDGAQTLSKIAFAIED